MVLDPVVSQESDSLSIVQAILQEDRNLELRPGDIALLVLIRDSLDACTDLAFAMAESDIRVLAARIDELAVRDPLGTERRLTESLNRLLRADCLARADMNRLRLTEETEYQLTTLGDAVAAWNAERARFTGEPLAAILRAFNSELSAIAARAEALDAPGHWRTEVLVPMQVVLRDLLVSVQRHQRQLDRQHEALRDFIPMLLKEHSEHSIERCETQLREVLETISDLVDVTLGASSTAFALIDRIEQLGVTRGIDGVDTVSQDIIRRMQSVVHWTRQRHEDWGRHHDAVHDYLRFVIHIDRKRRLTEALKRAVAEPPAWTLAVTDEPRLTRMREDPRPDLGRRTAVRRVRADYRHAPEEISADRVPERLQAIFDEMFATGEARWSSIVTPVIDQGLSTPDAVSHLPWLMGLMVRTGRPDPDCRDNVRVAPTLEIEELRVTSK